MTIEVTLAIQLDGLSDRTHAGRLVVERLSQLGGKLIDWTPENHSTARATFEFETEAQCVLFLKVALDIPGVEVATLGAVSDDTTLAPP